jgi:hypothetical protein
MLPLLTEEEARDTALLALTWATAKRISATHDQALRSEGEGFAGAMCGLPKKAQALGLLADSFHRMGNRGVMEELTAKADSIMAELRSHPYVAETFCRLALALRIGSPFYKEMLGEALQAARKSYAPEELGLDTEAEGTMAVESLFCAMRARRFSQITVTALKLDESAIAHRALNEALSMVPKMQQGGADLSLAFFSVLGALKLMDDRHFQRLGLGTFQQYAASLKEPWERSMILWNVCTVAHEIAVDADAPEFLELAWQALAAIPDRKWRDGKLAGLAYSSGRLGDRDFVIRRLPDLGIEKTPELELSLLAATLTGFAETDKKLIESPSLFALDTEIEPISQ